MKFLRKRFVLRFFSVSALLIFANSIFYPSVSYALTSGQFQPEYTSYEDAGTTDMVNLLTGDFNFNIPILSVPVGNYGDFPVPLSYHANISPEQEASWVGLGWNINVGSITRSINGFPDDANGEFQQINVKDLTGDRGWYSASLMGTYGWDSQIGKYGTVNLGIASFDYDEHGNTFQIAGISIGEHADIDANAFAMTIVRIVADIVTDGAAEMTFAASAMDAATAIMGNLAAASTYSPPQAPTINGYWDYSSRKEPKLFGVYTNYWYWLDKTRMEDMYGTLYLHNAPTEPYANFASFRPVEVKINGVSQSVNQYKRPSGSVSMGAASDINIDLSEQHYYNNSSPTMLAYDNFYVNGPGASGNIKPYRMEIGSVSVPREMSATHLRLSPVPFTDYGANKVPFVFEGSLGNSYINHMGSSSGAVNISSYNFGLNTSFGGGGDCVTGTVKHDLNDAILTPTQRLGPNVTSRAKLAQGQYIDWFNNKEIASTAGKFVNTSYMDYFKAPGRVSFRTAYTFGGAKSYTGVTISPNGGNSTITLDHALTPSEIIMLNGSSASIQVYSYEPSGAGGNYFSPYGSGYNVTISSPSGNQIQVNSSVIQTSPNGGYISIIPVNSPKPDNAIGGFVVTAADGMNYHYTIPVYDYNLNSKTVDKTDATKSSTYFRPDAFANTWLLTAITGPDFVDRGGSTGDGDGYIDENDWGYWIKFNYGKFGDSFMWAYPYSGTTSDSQNKYNSCSNGYKEKYFLNSIETQSHVALFIKGDRVDAKDASVTKLHSLRLCEISLLTKGAYKQLVDPTGSLQLPASSGVTNVMYQYNTGALPGQLSTAQISFLQANSLRRIVFNGGSNSRPDDYSLCIGAANSDVGSGKLTLNSVSIFGRNNFKALPDYKFSYGSNPVYNQNQWDGWGLWSSSGTPVGTTHKVSSNAIEGAAWSLSSIKSPLGNSINVTYERDTYSTISGNNIYANNIQYNGSYQVTTNQLSELFVNDPSQFNIGDAVYLNGNVTYGCQGQPANSQYNYYLGQFVVAAKTSNSIIFDRSYVALSCTTGTTTSVTNVGNVQKILKKPGGNLRVGAITVSDNLGGQTKTRYLYEENGTSQGTVSVEPDYIRGNDNDYPFYKLTGYPSTPVMYSKVSVLNGALTTDADYHTKTTYEFATPDQYTYIVNSDSQVKVRLLLASCVVGIVPWFDFTSVYKYQIDRRTAAIGKIKSVKVYDNLSSTPYSSRDFAYTESLTNNGINNNQGFSTEGTLLHEVVNDGFSNYHRAQRTTITNHPCALLKVTTTVDGQSTEQKNTNWDFYTGAVLEAQSKSPLGVITKTVLKPVYAAGGTDYDKLGSKSVDASFKNMLSQIAATYQYRIDIDGRELGLISASATTWKRDWANYRTIQSGHYGNSVDLYDLNNDGTISQSETDAQRVWRKFESYAWLGENARVNMYGVQSFVNGDRFNFTSGINPLWKKASSFERFDHYSQILELKDINQLFSTTKFGYNGLLPLLLAGNASYEEVGYSGAEDRLSSTSTFFGGEIGVGSGSVVSSPVHTGLASLGLSSGKGFIFNSSSLVTGKSYRASVWTTNPTFGQLYYNDGVDHIPTQVISQPITLPNGSTWYRIEVLIPAQNPAIEVGVKLATGSTGQTYFDDFRFQPTDAKMSCNVYNPNTLLVEYKLSNDNTYSRFSYDDAGRVSKVYVESIKPGQIGEKLIQESKYDYKRFHVDQ